MAPTNDFRSMPLTRDSLQRRAGEENCRIAAPIPTGKSDEPNSVRGISLSIWLNMLHDAFTLGLLRVGSGGFGDSPLPYTPGRLNADFVLDDSGSDHKIIFKPVHKS